MTIIIEIPLDIYTRFPRLANRMLTLAILLEMKRSEDFKVTRISNRAILEKAS